MGANGRFGFILGDFHGDRLRSCSEKAELTMTDLLRRMIEHCTQPAVFNEMIPAMSGRLEITNAVRR